MWTTLKSAKANGSDYSGPGMKEAVGALIFLALIGSHPTMWMRCKRRGEANPISVQDLSIVFRPPIFVIISFGN
jgi:hypothetical protein